MLGTRTDAEDVVQDAYLRRHQADDGEICSAEAWLTTVTTRLCIDRLRAASLEWRRYVGPLQQSRFPSGGATQTSPFCLSFSRFLSPPQTSLGRRVR
jgi:DNA-directed RNA polymerase specialized sigma24 family protein